MENTLSLSSVNASGPSAPARPFPSRTPLVRKLPPQGSQFTPRPIVPNEADIQSETPKPFSQREFRGREYLPEGSSTVEPKISEGQQPSGEPNVPEYSTPRIPIEFSTPQNIPAEFPPARNIPTEYTTQRNVPVEYATQPFPEQKLLHQPQEPHIYEVTEEVEMPPRRRKNFGRARKNRNSQSTELPIERLFSTTEQDKVSVNPSNTNPKGKLTSIPNYIKEHELNEQNKAKYRYNFFHDHANRARFKSKLKSTNRTVESDENEQEGEESGGDTPALSFAESKESPNFEIILPGSLNPNAHEAFYLADGKYDK